MAVQLLPLHIQSGHINVSKRSNAEGREWNDTYVVAVVPPSLLALLLRVRQVLLRAQQPAVIPSLPISMVVVSSWQTVMPALECCRNRRF
jgi:hypothetical protein